MRAHTQTVRDGQTDRESAYSDGKYRERGRDEALKPSVTCVSHSWLTNDGFVNRCERCAALLTTSSSFTTSIIIDIVRRFES